jgi:multidrug efflux pump subunit AcrB
MSPARFSVKQVVLVNLLFLVLMAMGVRVFVKIPVDVFPDISFNSAILTTLWPGASPSEVERLVTTKIEDEVRNVVGIKEWASFSSQSVSSIDIEWDETLSEIEQQAALNDLRAAVDRVDDLPADAEQTMLKELSVSEVFDICMVTVSDLGGVGEFALRDVARDIERKAERLPGVRKARLMGSRDRELRIYIDKDRALQYDLTLAEIAEIVRRNNRNVAGGTFSDPAQEEITVRGLGNFVSPEELAATVVKKSPNGNHITLGEVAEVVSGFERRVIYGYFNGAPTIAVGISKTSGSDVGEVVGRVRQLVEAQRSLVPPGLELALVRDSSEYVGNRMRILRDNLLLGVGFVILILWLSVGFRNSMLAIVGIPFSFLAAMILFPALDITINALSLVGFVMVSGMLVDGAIIVLENIYRHIESGEPVTQAVVDGTEEVMWPVISAVCTTMAAFIPMLLITGTTGEFMSILPKTVIACLIASLVECLLMLPAHYLDWGSRSTAAESLAAKGDSLGPVAGLSYRARDRVDGLIRAFRELYRRGLDAVLANRGAFLCACVAAVFFSWGLSQHMRVNLFPNDFNDFFVTVKTPTDYSLDQTNQVVLDVQKAMAPLQDEFEEVFAFVGHGMTADEQPIFGTNYGVFFISFPNTRENVANPTRVLNLTREVLAEYQASSPHGLDGLIIAPPRNGPPIGKPVAVRIQSDNYDLAKRLAGLVELELASMPGVFNIEDNVPEGRRELQVRLDEHRASIHGLSFQELGTALLAANEGLVPSTFKDPLSDEDVDIRVLPIESQRDSAADLLDVEIRTPGHYLVKLRDVATVSLERGYQRLYHYGARRAVVVYADVDNELASSVSVNEALKARFADIPERYPGVDLVFGGEFEATNEAFSEMGRALLIALFAIYGILAAQFRSYLQPLVVMCVIAFAFTGVVLGMYLWDYALSMYVIYATVGLAGVVVNDSLVLIDFVNRERAAGADALQAVRVAGQRRFRAILLTTLTTIAGLLPMAMGISGASPVFGPFAAAIVAGLAVASLLTLFVVPSLYLLLEDVKQRLTPRRGPESPGQAWGETATSPAAGAR